MQNSKQVIEKAFHQPSCEHNSSDLNGKKSCVYKPSGGESCAFDGAYIVLNPIRDAAHLIHGGITCGGHNYESRGAYSSGSRLYRYCFSTDISEIDIIFGAEKKLYNAINEIYHKFCPPVIFVYQTCVPAMTGEELESVCKKTSRELNIDVIPVAAPGFLGHKNLGNRIAGDVLLKHVIGKNSKKDSKLNPPPLSINLIGEYNIAGDLWSVLPLFQKLGIEVAAKITGDADYGEVQRANLASLNLLICSRALINVAAGMLDEYAIPFYEVSFFGIGNTAQAINKVLQHFINVAPGLRRQLEVAQQMAERMEQEARNKMEQYRKILKGKKALVYSGGVKSWSMISALHDMGIEVVGVGVKKAGKTDIEKIKELVGKDKMVSDTAPQNMLRIIKEENADFLIAGSRNQYLAFKEKIPYIDINQERHTAYAGYEGALNLAHDLCKTLHSPVWELAKSSAPWDPIEKLQRESQTMEEEAMTK